MAKIEVKQHVGMAGKFKLTKHLSDGTITGEYEFDNLITNQGLDRIATNIDYLHYCYVGSGNTTPIVTDTTLETQVALKQNTSNPNISNSGSPDYYSTMKKTYTFGEGEAEGNLSEIGIGWSGNAVFSRALILDEFDSPTTITILSNEFLTVDYELRVYPKLTDDTGTVVFTGSKGGSYDWIFRSANVDDINWLVSFYGIYFTSRSFPNSDLVSSSDIGTVLTQPDNPVGLGTSYSSATYTPGTYSVNFTRSLSISQANFAGGLRSFYFIRGVGQYQIQFDPAIPKQNTDTLTFIYTVSWGRV